MIKWLSWQVRQASPQEEGDWVHSVSFIMRLDGWRPCFLSSCTPTKSCICVCVFQWVKRAVAPLPSGTSAPSRRPEAAATGMGVRTGCLQHKSTEHASVQLTLQRIQYSLMPARVRNDHIDLAPLILWYCTGTYQRANVPDHHHHCNTKHADFMVWPTSLWLEDFCCHGYYNTVVYNAVKVVEQSKLLKQQRQSVSRGNHPPPTSSWLLTS